MSKPVLAQYKIAAFVVLLVSTSTLFVTTFHGTFATQAFMLQNGETLKWHLGLLKAGGEVNCEATNMPLFHIVCMTLFKNLFQSYDKIARLICTLHQRAATKMDASLQPHIVVYAESCPEATQLKRISYTTSGLIVASGLVLTALCVTLSSVLSTAMSKTHKLILVAAQTFIGVALLIALAIYHTTLYKLVQRIFDYSDPVNLTQSIIYPLGEPNFGAGLIVMYLISGLLILNAILVTFCPTEDHPKKKDTMPTTSSKETFWAFIPEVCQPSIFVADVYEDATDQREQQSLVAPPTLNVYM